MSDSGVNWLIDVLCCKRLPAIDLAHIDLTGSEQRPEQHRRRICRWQHGPGFDPLLELFVQTLAGRPKNRGGEECSYSW